MAFGAALFRRLFRFLVVFVSAVLAAVILVPAGPAAAAEARPPLLTSIKRTSAAVIDAGTTVTFDFTASKPVIKVQLLFFDDDVTSWRYATWTSQTASTSGTVSLHIDPATWASGELEFQSLYLRTDDQGQSIYRDGSSDPIYAPADLGNLADLDFTVNNPHLREPAITALAPSEAVVSPGETAAVTFTVSQAATHVSFSYSDDSQLSTFVLQWTGPAPRGPFTATASAPITSTHANGKYTLESVDIQYVTSSAYVRYGRDGTVSRNTSSVPPASVPSINLQNGDFTVNNPENRLTIQKPTAPPSITGKIEAPTSYLQAEIGTWPKGIYEYKYQWLRNGVPIPGETDRWYGSSSYNDAGSRISIRVTVLAPGALPSSAVSTPVGPIPRIVEFLNGNIRGDASVGGRLRLEDTQVLLTPKGGTTKITCGWRRNGAVIPGVTRCEYVLTQADVGASIAVAATATNDGNSSDMLPVWLRPRVAKKAPGRGMNADGTMDIFARDNAGNLYLYPTNGRGSWLPRQRIGGGWNIYNALLSAGDWNGDGKNDVIARDRLGRLFLYPGNGRGGIPTKVQIGGGWQNFRDMIAPGDFNGDGNNDIVARDKSSNVWLYPGNGRGGWMPRRLITSGWGELNLMVAAGKSSGENTNNIFSRDIWGGMGIYPGDGRGGLLLGSGYWSLGAGWNTYSRIGSAGDFNGDWIPDFYGIKPSGEFVMYYGNGSAWYKGHRVVGGNWNQFTAVF